MRTTLFIRENAMCVQFHPGMLGHNAHVPCTWCLQGGAPGQYAPAGYSARAPP
jgi:hypothetical protein